MKSYGLYLLGKYIQTPESLPVNNPLSSENLRDLRVATAGDGGEFLELALEGASETFGQIQRGFFPLSERLAFLERLKSKLAEQAESLAYVLSLEVAKPISLARAEVKRALSTLKWTCLEAPKLFSSQGLPVASTQAWQNWQAWTQRQARGPLLAITPFNFPVNLVMHKLAPALAAGCPVILKASPKGALTALTLADLCQACELPAGMLSVIQCDNEAILRAAKDSRVRQVSFTGSAKVGWMLARNLEKPLFLELGGTAPAFVDKTANLKKAAEQLISNAFSYAGQVCISVQNIFAEKSIAANFQTLLSQETENFKWGLASDENNGASCVIDEAAALRLKKSLDGVLNRGAKILAESQKISEAMAGPFVRPTLLTQIRADDPFATEEIFGPFVNLFETPSFDDWLVRANQSPYRLQASVYTSQMNLAFRAAQELDFGGVIINESPALRLDPMPYGGNGQSGAGREGPRYAMEEFTTLKAVILNPES